MTEKQMKQKWRSVLESNEPITDNQFKAYNIDFAIMKSSSTYQFSSNKVI